MEKNVVQPPHVLKLIAHDIRWRLVHDLARSDYNVQQLSERLKLSQNLVSYHLRKLREGHLVNERRSSADEREVYYRLDLDQLQIWYLAAGSFIHPSITMTMESVLMQAQALSNSAERRRVLFLCTENSARSQMAEALLRQESRGSVEAYSAGSQPASSIHPLARRVMEHVGIDMREAVPKHVRVFEGEVFDVIITVCDRVVASCPTFPDDPEHMHWSFLDPASIQGTEGEQLRAFEQTASQLTTRIRALLPLLARKKSHADEQ